MRRLARHIPAQIERHGDEAGFLWLQRDAGCTAPHWWARHLADCDRRLEDHLEGLGLDPAAGWQRIAQGLEDPGELFCAVLLAAAAPQPERLAAVAAAAVADPALGRAAASALAWMQASAAAPLLAAWGAAADPALQRIALAGAACRRSDPGDLAGRLLDHPLPRLRERALRAAGELGRRDLVPRLLPHLEDAEPACRCAAASSLALLERGGTALGRLPELAGGGHPASRRALHLAARLLPAESLIAWQGRLAASIRTRRLAIAVAGASGLPELLAWLMEHCAKPAWERVAGEAIALISGCDPEHEQLTRSPPDRPEPDPDEEPGTPVPAEDPDGGLPWIDRERLRRWLDRHPLPAGRLLCGRPAEISAAQAVLVAGTQRQRALAALEVARWEDGPLPEVRAARGGQPKPA